MQIFTLSVPVVSMVLLQPSPIKELLKVHSRELVNVVWLFPQNFTTETLEKLL